MKKVPLVLLLAVLAASLPFTPAHASLSACSASVSPSSIGLNQSGTLTFSVTNNDGANNGVWVRITSPSDDFQINTGNSSGWGRSFDSSTITFINGTLSPSASQNFNVTVQTGLNGSSGQDWAVQVADSAGGSNPTTCTGTTSVAISGDSTPPVLSNITAANITNIQASITWTTNELATSIVRYGLSGSYGSTQTSNTPKTSHNVTLNGLSAGTIYHYQVESVDGSGNSTSSSDKVFTTSNQGDGSLVISSVSAGTITTSSATVTWNTNNAANSRVDYGTTTSYGQNEASASYITNHSQILSGLSASTTYHYKVTSSDQNGNTVVTSDNTFVTATPSSGGGGGGSSSSGGSGSGSGSSGGGSSNSTPPPSTTTKPSSSSSSGGGSGGSSGGSSSSGGSETLPPPPGDTTPPTISVSTDFSKPYSTPPVLTGSATDNESVQTIWYSRDDGANWLPISDVPKRNTAHTTFSAGLPSLPDDTYLIRFRAEDASGNRTISPSYRLTIDQLPPLVGTSLYAVGAQVISSSATTLTTVIAGVDQRITLSAVGGPTSIDIVAHPKNGSGEEHVFSLVKNPDTGLWLGTIHLPDVGSYELVARAIDGANNKTERLMRTITAVPGSKVVYDKKPVNKATVTILSFDPLTSRFSPWDAAPFKQVNPQITTANGEFEAFLPPGTYYLTIDAPGMRSAQTPIFSLDRNTPLQLVISLTKGWPFMPSWWRKTVPLTKQNNAGADDTAVTHPAIGQKLPDTLSSLVKGSTLVTFLTEWSPHTAEQLTQLQEVNRQSPGSVLVVLVQSTSQQATLLRDRGRYDLPIVADEKGEAALFLGIDTTPANLIVGEDGIIKDVRYESRSYQELLGALKELVK